MVSIFLSFASLWSGPIFCGCSRAASPQAAARTAESPVRFREVTREAGIHYSLGHGGRHPLTILEAVGCGGAFLDFDRDGHLDLLLVGQPTRSPQPSCALYRNLGGTPTKPGHPTFEDVTEAAGLTRSALWMGCAVGDYDNDGYPDLLLTGHGALALLHNEAADDQRRTTNDQRPVPSNRHPEQASGPPSSLAVRRSSLVVSRRFADVTARMRLRATPGDWFTSAGWADVDRDGYLDLYVARYVRYGEGSPRFCNLGVDAKGQPVQGSCGPELYTAQRGVFYRSRGGHGFEEATARYGLNAAHGKGLGVAFGDFDDDRWPDLYVANDRTPGDLFRNDGGRRFVSVGSELGTAYSGDSRPQAGMGVDWGDYNGDGRLDLIVTTFFLERKSLYRNEGPSGFQEVSDERGLSPAIRYVGWGNRWLDADNDGRLDWALANGHAVDNMALVDPEQPYAQPTQIFHNEGEQFREIGAQACPALSRPIAGRGVAVGDYDNDGRADILVTNAEGEPLLLHNESPTGHHWLRVRLVGRRGNRDAAGARVWVTTDGRPATDDPGVGRPTPPTTDGSPAPPATQMREVTTGGSYLSASEPRLLFGLGDAARAARLRIRWPGGETRELRDVPGDREVTIEEGAITKTPGEKP